MNNEFISTCEKILRESVFLERIAHIRELNNQDPEAEGTFRHLESGDIIELESQGNYSPDWGTVLVRDGFNTRWIRNSSFIGSCVLGIFTGITIRPDGDAPIHSGIYDSTLINSRIGSECLICGAKHLADYSVMDGAVVYHVNSLSAKGPCLFGNGTGIAVGNETGGRIVFSFAELTAPLAAEAALNAGDSGFQTAYREFTQRYSERAALDFGVVECGAVIRHTTRVSGSYIGTGVLIDGAACVTGSTLLGSGDMMTEVSHGAHVAGSCVQKGCEITTMAIVESSLLLECSHVERHGKVYRSIIGPATGIAEGEVTSSLVGPLVSFHHQAMLIGAIWPEGRGNIGSGANVGSNHTSRLADQEIFPGEGTFFGLGVNVKFPSDFTAAPYSILATGICTQPQRVEFPFSLINDPSPEYKDPPRGLNEIIPGWVISQNFYAIVRNEEKYRERSFPGMQVSVNGIVRHDIIDRVIIARDRLNRVRAKLDFYTADTMDGLGKNFLSEKQRLAGLDAYNFIIGLYALSALAGRVHDIITGKTSVKISSVYTTDKGDPSWEHASAVLTAEGFSGMSIKDNLTSLSGIMDSAGRMVQESRERDDRRGTGIYSDYASSHVPASVDMIVTGTWERVKETKKIVEDCIRSLPSE